MCMSRNHVNGAIFNTSLKKLFSCKVQLRLVVAVKNETKKARMYDGVPCKSQHGGDELEIAPEPNLDIYVTSINLKTFSLDFF